jgi:hypothetical protein
MTTETRQAARSRAAGVARRRSRIDDRSEVALIRRHAKTMACIVVELYQEGCRFPSRSPRALSAPTNGSKLRTMVGAVI